MLVHVGFMVLVAFMLVIWYTPCLRSVKVRDWFPFPLVDGLAGADEDPARGAGGSGHSGRGGRCARSRRPWGGQSYVA